MAHFHRRPNSLRYPGYDYAAPGAIFVTICTGNRQHLFGRVHDGQMIHSAAGGLVADRFRAIPTRFTTVDIDAFVVMPDHVHGILFTGTDPDDAARTTVGEAVRWLKTSVHRRYVEGVRRHGWKPFHGTLWQPDYHDRIVRTDAELDTIRAYIEGNPGRWWEKYGDGS